ASVQIVTLPALPPKGDVSDWLLTHGGTDLEALTAETTSIAGCENTGDAAFEPSTEPSGVHVTVPTRSLGDLLVETEAFVLRYVVLPLHASVAVALWIAHTYVFKAFDVTPYLHVTSPVKRSGKTRLLEVLETLVWAAWRIAGASQAVLFRKIERDAPTLLFD